MSRPHVVSVREANLVEHLEYVLQSAHHLRRDVFFPGDTITAHCFLEYMVTPIEHTLSTTRHVSLCFHTSLLALNIPSKITFKQENFGWRFKTISAGDFPVTLLGVLQ